MTDRELLELAARAAGITLEYIGEEWVGNSDELMPVYYEGKTYHSWNPLDDDGDALRLAVYLRLIIAWDRWNDNDYVCIRHRDLNEEIGIQIDQSPEKTVRRAIVMAAAEIGRAM